MRKSTQKSPDARQETDKAKRVYRAVLDTIKKIDESSKQQKTFRDVFLPESIGLRNRLKDYCERLMFYDALQYGRRAEELLWRKVFYDIIQKMKHNRRQQRPSKSIETAFRTHLAAAMGYYHHLLLRLQVEFSVPLEGVVDFHVMPEPKSHKKLSVQVAPKDPEKEAKIQEWAIKACHRCLVCLGDIARYQHDYDGFQSLISSRRYYYQALSVLPTRGMPHNQLGTLAGSRYYNMEAAYHYLRCMMCVTSFEGAQGNLTRLFEKNRKRYADVNQFSPRDLPPDIQRSKDVKRFLVRFMQLLDVFHNKNNSVEAGLQELCQNTLHDFDLCMFYTPSQRSTTSRAKSFDDRPDYLDNHIVFELFVMMMITIHKLQQTGSKEVTAAIAFHLAMFSHLLSHVTTRLQNTLYEIENPRQHLDAGSTESSGAEEPSTNVTVSPRPSTTINVSNSTEEPTQDKAKKKAKLTKLRRRRRREENAEVGDYSSESDLSEGEDEVHDDLLSESDEELSFLNKGSDSASDSDDLMESQEMRPGFFQNSTPDELERGLERLDLQNLQRSFTAGLGGDGMLNGFGFPSNQSHTDFIMDPNMDNYLKDFSSQLFSSSSTLLPNLGLGTLFSSTSGTDSADDVCKDVMQGKKDVSVPPGFAGDPEARHVAEITEKLNAFNIDTDTDTSIFLDTDNSSVQTESDNDMEEDEMNSQGSVIDMNEVENRMKLLDVICNEGLLPTVKILCDWMKCHPQIVSTCSQSSQSLWTRLSVLLNFLPAELDMTTLDICSTSEVVQIVEKCHNRTWTQNQPLREDVNLRGFPPLKDVHNKLMFTFKKRLDLSDTQESVLRICCLRKFGYHLSKMKNIQLTFNTEKNMFFGPLEIAAADEKSAQEKMAETEARRNQLMRDMAQLRLQAEVSQLEGTLKSADQPNLPPYLVPDTPLLCTNMNVLKQLVTSARFIVIVPIAVIDHLDSLKKSTPNAREAIRWLEAEFRKGNRYIRAQKAHEKCITMPQKNLKKKDQDAWRFHQLISCCNYLSQQNPDCASKGMVCILTNQTMISSDASLRVRQAVANAMQEGIRIENIDDFFNKWKDLWKNTG